MKNLSRFILKLIGWNYDKGENLPDKFLLITYPHTSNWDFIISLLIQWAVGLKVYWVAKHTLFKGVMKFVMYRLNAIPVNRAFPKNFIDDIVKKFNDNQKLIVAIAPEGTRKKTKYIKTGFYDIAIKAQAPFVLGYLDYSKKNGGFGTIIEPSGDINKDLGLFNTFYGGKVPLYPEKASPLEVISSNKKDIQIKKRL